MLNVVMLNVANNPFMLSVVMLSCRLQMLDLSEKACQEETLWLICRSVSEEKKFYKIVTSSTLFTDRSVSAKSNVQLIEDFSVPSEKACYG
jgi:hypothetical protein